MSPPRWSFHQLSYSDMSQHFSIHPVRGQEDLQDTIRLFSAYVKWLDVDLTFQDFEKELQSLPGKYSQPFGEILLARDLNGSAVGCVAVRPLLETKVCEMKRLYVLPEVSGLGIGRELVKHIMNTAVKVGYNEMKLDTLSSMEKAIRLYQKMGFTSTMPYYPTPLNNTVFLAKKLPQA